MRRLCLIVNPHAGGGRTAAALPAVESVLREHGLEHRVERTRSLEHAIELGREAVTAGEVAVSFGGDGLAGAVAHAVRGTDGVLGILPGGRGNDFARKLGISREPAEAAHVLATGTERRIDVGDVEGRTFLGIASYGIDSDVQDIANEARLVRGQLVYAYAAVRALIRWKPMRLTYAPDGRPERAILGYAIAACNSGMFGGGMALAPDADLSDGKLDLIVQGRTPKRQYLLALPKVFKGTHLEQDEIEVLQATEVRVDCERPYKIYADGDQIGMTPATIRAIPDALRVLVP